MLPTLAMSAFPPPPRQRAPRGGGRGHTTATLREGARLSPRCVCVCVCVYLVRAHTGTHTHTHTYIYIYTAVQRVGVRLLEEQDKVLRSYFAQKGGTRGQRGEGTHGQGREHVKWDMYE